MKWWGWPLADFSRASSFRLPHTQNKHISASYANGSEEERTMGNENISVSTCFLWRISDTCELFKPKSEFYRELREDFLASWGLQVSVGLIWTTCSDVHAAEATRSLKRTMKGNFLPLRFWYSKCSEFSVLASDHFSFLLWLISVCLGPPMAHIVTFSFMWFVSGWNMLPPL